MIGNYFWGGAAAPYQIEQSLRFDGTSGKLTRTNPASSGITNAYKWSYSFWIKHSDVSSSATITQPLLSGGNTSGSGYTYCGWGYSSAGRFWIGNYTGADYRPDIRPTDRVWRDPSAWQHFMLVYDTSEGTNTDRIKIYSNGVRWDLSSVGSTISATQLFYAVNYATKASNIGYDNIANSYFDGYMAEVHFVDGQALDQYSFGEFDDNGVWRPIKYTGTYGLNGHYLKFDPSATNGIGHDHSGNGNNFTPSGFTTSGTGTDVMSDTPTTNWCTLNPLSFGPSNADMIDGNLRLNTPTATYGNAKGTIAVSSGKWYWEVTPQTTATANVAGGILGAAETSITSPPGAYATGYAYLNTGEKSNNGTDTAYGATYGANDVIGTALDLDAGTLVFYKNGVSQGTAFSSLSGTFVPAIGDTSSTSGAGLVCNFGQRDFEYTPPTGFNALNTANLPAPDIADGSEHFDTSLDTGANILSSAQSIFSNGLWWIKDRANSNQHQFVDSLRGSTSAILSPSTVVAGTYAAPTGNSVAWCWNVPDTFTPTATGGLTLLSGRRNVDAGFSMVKYTGSGTSASFTHGLSQAPELAIFLPITRSGKDGATFVSELGTGKSLYLRRSLSALNISNYYGTPTSSDFLIGTDAQVNDNTFQYMCYLWHSVPGYSSIGSYTGNGNNDGPFVFLGFRPALILTKRTNSTSNWVIQDSTRQTYNPSDAWLRPNTSGAEGTTNPDLDLDFLSNGFKVRNNGTDNNISGSTYIFMALAENPFGGDGVSPATAR